MHVGGSDTHHILNPLVDSFTDKKSSPTCVHKLIALMIVKWSGAPFVLSDIFGQILLESAIDWMHLTIRRFYVQGSRLFNVAIEPLMKSILYRICFRKFQPEIRLKGRSLTNRPPAHSLVFSFLTCFLFPAAGDVQSVTRCGAIFTASMLTTPSSYRAG